MYSVCHIVLFFSRPRSEGWQHHGCTFSIYICPVSFWLTPSRKVLSTYRCCPSRPCVVFLACVHLALFLALSISPGNLTDHGWHEQPLNEVVEALAPNSLVEFLSLLSYHVYWNIALLSLRIGGIAKEHGPSSPWHNEINSDKDMITDEDCRSIK